jgi:hypothetical protein
MARPSSVFAAIRPRLLVGGSRPLVAPTDELEFRRSERSSRSTADSGAVHSSPRRPAGRRAFAHTLLALACTTALLLAPALALAQSGSASYQIPRQSIDGGAGRATSAAYTLHGTIAQPDAGATMTSASYTLRGGFHRAAPAAPLPDPLFSDGFEAP